MSTLAQPQATIGTAAPAAGILRNFHPGWFAAVMGTGIVGVTAYLNPGGIAGLRNAAHTVGVAFVLLAWVLAIAIAIPYLARLVRYRDAALADLRHPIVGALYATVPGRDPRARGRHRHRRRINPSRAHGHADRRGARRDRRAARVRRGVLFAYVLFTGDGVSGDTANGGWFIPPVVAIIIPLTFIPLLPHVSHSTGVLLLLLGYATFGIGLLLFLLIAAMLFAQAHLSPASAGPARAVAVDRAWSDRRRQPRAAAPRRRRAPVLGNRAPPPSRTSPSSARPRSGASGCGGLRSRRCC